MRENTYDCIQVHTKTPVSHPCRNRVYTLIIKPCKSPTWLLVLWNGRFGEGKRANAHIPRNRSAANSATTLPAFLFKFLKNVWGMKAGKGGHARAKRNLPSSILSPTFKVFQAVQITPRHPPPHHPQCVMVWEMFRIIDTPNSGPRQTKFCSAQLLNSITEIKQKMHTPHSLFLFY